MALEINSPGFRQKTGVDLSNPDNQRRLTTTTANGSTVDALQSLIQQEDARERGAKAFEDLKIKFGNSAASFKSSVATDPKKYGLTPILFFPAKNNSMFPPWEMAAHVASTAVYTVVGFAGGLASALFHDFVFNNFVYSGISTALMATGTGLGFALGTIGIVQAHLNSRKLKSPHFLSAAVEKHISDLQGQKNFLTWLCNDIQIQIEEIECVPLAQDEARKRKSETRLQDVSEGMRPTVEQTITMIEKKISGWKQKLSDLKK